MKIIYFLTVFVLDFVAGAEFQALIGTQYPFHVRVSTTIKSRLQRPGWAVAICLGIRSQQANEVLAKTFTIPEIGDTVRP